MATERGVGHEVLTDSQLRRPNVVIVMADDLGFSDIGCFGSEIETPNLDKLGEGGVRLTQMYNCARCCPSRASLMTGLYPHQAGIGHMVHDRCEPRGAYQGYLRDDCATMAEVMKASGYRTLMAGKWHCGGEYPPHLPEHWVENAGNGTHPLPVQRGFDEHYGTLGGAGSYFDPPCLIRNEELILETPDDYYYTDAIHDEAVRMIEDTVRGGKDPFFLYIAELAPHWPLHCKPKDIEKYIGKYRGGWDELRRTRYESLKEKGLIKPGWDCSPRHEKAFPWTEAEHKDWEDSRMATYAAMIDVMDQGIGRVVQALTDLGIFDDTLIMFLSDNGGCAEFLREDGDEGNWPEYYGGVASNGTNTVVGNDPNRRPGGKDSFMSYDVAWSCASNTPFRLFKSWVHEGGIATPFLAHWPNGIKVPGRIHHNPWIMLDIVATCYEICDVAYPDAVRDTTIPALEGESFASIFEGKDPARRTPIFWEHQGNRAVRIGRWKLVNEHSKDWELFDMEVDRTELNDLSAEEEDIVKELIAMYEQWALRCGVRPWPLQGDGEDYSHRPWDW